ncbi:SpoIIE family protein phosphatase [bacterium]|nr:SpoIIE family protein phosphatase [bacterium]
MNEKQPRTISIRWIVSGGAMLLTAIAVLAVSFVGERNSQSVITRELQTRLIVEARNLAMTSSRALLSDFPELTLAPIIAEMNAAGTRQEQTAVVDLEGMIRGHANARRIGEPFALPGGMTGVQTAAGLKDGEAVFENEELLIAAAPVNHPQGHRIGSAYVSFPRDYVASVLAEIRRKQLFLAGIMLAAGFLVAPLMMTQLLRPVAALREGLERIGRGDLDSPVQLKDRTEFGLLARTMNRMSRGLREAQKEKAEKDRLTHEVELARQIQSSLLPAEDLVAGAFRVYGAHRAAAEVGGDLWDTFELEDGRIGLVIADVSGKGLGGCLVTSMLSALLRAFRNEETSPSAMLARLESHLPLRTGTFITMFYGILDPASGELVFASAAHSPMLVRRAATGTAEWYRTDGIPIGAVKGGALARTLKDERVRLEPGDVLVQYTDGINEAFDPSGRDQFGFERIEKAVADAAGRDGRTVIDRLRHDLEAWAGDQPPLDDETLLVVTRGGAAVPASTGPAAPPCSAIVPSGPSAPGQLLAEARKRGNHLLVPAALDRLTGLADWIRNSDGFDTIAPSALTLIESALYETCANIIEHGYQSDAQRSLDVWWVRCAETCDRLCGRFLIIDNGLPFRPEDRKRLDFADEAVRRRGRGIGLEIIHEAMHGVAYHPGTEEGNVTILAFDQAQSLSKEMTNG